MLYDIEEAFEFLTYLDRVSSFQRRLTCTFTADIQEYRSILIVKILIVDPVSLLKAPFVCNVEMINDLSEVKL